MRCRNLAKGSILVLVAGLLTGCFRAAELARVRRDIERQAPGIRFEKQVELSLGPMTLGLVRLLSFLAPDTRDAREILRQIDRVKVAVYRAEEAVSPGELSLPQRISRLLERQGWEMAVRAREQNGQAWVFYRAREEAVRDFYLVVLESEELVLVRMEGRLERLVAYAVQQRRDLHARNIQEPGDGRVPFPGNRYVRNATLPDFWEVEGEGPVARYNRVDGLYVGWQEPSAVLLADRLVGYGELGYAFGGEHWRYRLGLERHFRRGPGQSTLGVEIHELTDTQDGWLIPEEENSLDALLVRRDFRDYYRRSGRSAYLSCAGIGGLQLTGRLGRDEFGSMENAASWSLLDAGPARGAFRPNPAVDEVRLHSLRAELRYDARDSPSHPGRGWLIDGLIEKAGGFLGGDRSFRRFLAEVRRYQPLVPGARLDLRARLGAAGGRLPVQYQHALGGISSLRGYRFKAFTGDRLALFNAECWFDLGYLHLPGPLASPNLGVFLDAGSAWFAGEPPASGDGGRQYEPDLKTSAGVAIDLEDLRLCWARPLAAGEGGWKASLRLSRTF